MDKYPELLQILLKNKGYTTAKQAEVFLHPDYDAHTHDPFLLQDMERAVLRIIRAIDNEEMIAVYTDFDADGIPGGVLLHDFFTKVGYERFINYIPHRDTEGYGFHASAVDTLAQKGVSLIITVDVGITGIEAVAHASSLGVDCIITDHHEPADTLPDAYAIINPKRKHETYPYRELCGTGVAYKVVQATLLRAQKEGKTWVAHVKPGWEKWLLDLVAIATVADMVPLTGENRVLVHWGLFVLRRSRRPGIHALCKKLSIKQHLLDEGDIGFMIGPRINAASRMGTPEDAFTLLATQDLKEAQVTATHLQKLNNQRKGVVSALVKKLHARFGDMDREELPAVLVAGDPTWSPALLGLVANSLVNTFDRPVCIWGREGTGVLKGSCRTDGTVSVVDLLRTAGDSLLGFGGHVGAGGFSVSNEEVHTLPDTLVRAYEKAKYTEKKNATPSFDTEIFVADVSPQTHTLVNKLAPFGIENDKPVFLLRNVHIQAVRLFGKDKNHIEVMIAEDEHTTTYKGRARAYSFFATETSFTTVPKAGMSVNIIATLERALFRGVQIELRILDIV